MTNTEQELVKFYFLAEESIVLFDERMTFVNLTLTIFYF